MKTKLLAHWPLKGNINDVAGNHHGVAHGVNFCAGPDGAAGSAVRLDGPRCAIEVPDQPALRFGLKDFTVALRVKCDGPMHGPFGDLLSKFDPAARCGFNFSICGTTPAYSGMTDTRHVHFGMDDGYIGEWETLGRPLASNPLITNLVVFEDNLYCGIADADDWRKACRVFRWAGHKQWVDCGRLGSDPSHLSVQSMFVHQGRLYAGTGVWDWVRASGNNFKPGRTSVFVYEGGKKWRDLGPVGRSARVLCMASFDGALFVGLDRVGGGHCFRLDGKRWIDCGAPNGDNVEDLLAFDNALYGTTHGMIYRYAGDRKWTCVGDHPHKITQIHSIEVCDGAMIVGTWPQGYVLRYAGGREWTIMGRLGIAEGLAEINEINDLIVHNGKLYAGVLPKAQVYRYESDGHWTLLRSLAGRPEYDEKVFPTWNRVTCLASFRGKLLAGTGACQARACDLDRDRTVGTVYALQTGQVASYERDIGNEWTHLAATRRGNQLELFINGESRCKSVLPKGVHLDLSNTRPLLIGRGAQSAFSGAIADVRLYAGALPAGQVRALALAE